MRVCQLVNLRSNQGALFLGSLEIEGILKHVRLPHIPTKSCIPTTCAFNNFLPYLAVQQKYIVKLVLTTLQM